jgi:lipopolysaccharide transport system ATP-binding protein
MKRAEIERKFDEIVSFAEIEKFLDTPVKRYSSGMYVRLAFSVAAHLEPDILLVDEVLAVGDATFQKKCLGKMGDVTKGGRTVLFVSHSMASILNLCGRAILLDVGKIRVAGSVQHVVDAYLSEGMGLEGEVVFSEERVHPNSGLRFVSVRILDSDGHPAAYVDLLKGFTLEIEYEVLRSVRSAQVAFEVWNSMGICVLCSSDFDANPEDSMNIKHPGRYRASCFIPPTYLRSGRYWIDLGSSIPGIQMLDEVHNAIAFEVVDSGSVEFKLSQGRRGVIAPILRWHADRIN